MAGRLSVWPPESASTVKSWATGIASAILIEAGSTDTDKYGCTPNAYDYAITDADIGFTNTNKYVCAAHSDHSSSNTDEYIYTRSNRSPGPIAAGGRDDDARQHSNVHMV